MPVLTFTQHSCIDRTEKYHLNICIARLQQKTRRAAISQFTLFKTSSLSDGNKKQTYIVQLRVKRQKKP